MSEDCIFDQREAFDIYDQAVDTICCWESMLGHLYEDVFNSYNFERFPNIPNNSGDNPLTPDFTTYFNEKYGVIGEVKWGFPDKEVAFDKTLSQIENYADPKLELKTNNGDRKSPEVCDIILIISGSSALETGQRISDKIGDDSRFNFKNNLVLMRYDFNNRAAKSRYEFERIPTTDQGFRDDALPDDISLSKNAGESGGYKKISVYPKHFVPVKSRRPLCNDKPPEIYLATVLWHRIFPEFLDEAEYREWRSSGAQKTITISTSVGEIRQKLNSYLQNGSARKQWVSDTVDFLDTANLARTGKNRATIKFRDLVQDVGEDTVQDDMGEFKKSRELGYMISRRYCEYVDSQQSQQMGSEAEQSSIESFDTGETTSTQ